jgi:cytochrome c peroxidase
MMYSVRTPPVLTRGTRENTYANIVNSFKFDNYTILTDEQYDAVEQYLKSLIPVQSPYRNRDGSLTDSAKRGEKLFKSQGCVTCHPAPLYTDMNMHPPKARADNWEKELDIKYDTPSLVETWRSGPWMNDGSKATLREAVEISLPKGHNLKSGEIDDLTNFVGSIGSEGE